MLALLLLLTIALVRPAIPTPTDGLARAELRSPAYFAVILRSGPPCSLGAAAVAEAQAAFPEREVFSSDFECGPEENVTFSGVAEGVDFVAVYAGRSRREAEHVLREARRRWRDANLRRLQTMAVAP